MKHSNEYTIPICNAFSVLSEDTIFSECERSNDHQPISPSNEAEFDSIPSCNADRFSIRNASAASAPTVLVETNKMNITDFVFRSMGLHIANLNVRHLLPKLDELRISMDCENGPDVLGICETFLNESIYSSQLTINGFDHIRKDRSDTKDKAGGSLILYFRNKINCNLKYQILKQSGLKSHYQIQNLFLYARHTVLLMKYQVGLIYWK